MAFHSHCWAGFEPKEPDLPQQPLSVWRWHCRVGLQPLGIPQGQISPGEVCDFCMSWDPQFSSQSVWRRGQLANWNYIFLKFFLSNSVQLKITVGSVLQVWWRQKEAPNQQKLSSNGNEKSVQYHNRVSNKSLYQFTWLGLSTECIFIDSFLWGW